MTERIEDSIIRNLIFSEEYYRKVIPHIDPAYFESIVDKTVFEEIYDFSTKYDKIPTKEILKINIAQRSDLNDEVYKDSVQKIETYSDEDVDIQWLLDSTENGVRIEQSTTPYYSRSRSQMEAIRNYQRMRSQVSYKKPYQYRSTNT